MKKLKLLLMGISQMALFLQKSNYITFITITLSVVYFIAVYTICEYYYPGTSDSATKGWWHMKTDSYLLIVCIWIYIASRPKQTIKSIKRIQKVIIDIGIGYGLSNFIDRRLIHDREFGMNDLAIIVVFVLVAQINLKEIMNRAIKNL